jgi:steroid delta-isomerase-like uncharacterized protein
MKDLLQSYVGAINAHDVDAVAACFAEDVENHAAIPEAQGKRGVRTIFGKLLRAVPDVKMRVEDVICEGDRIVCRATMTGTNTGTLEFSRFPLPATGKTATFAQIHIFRVADGKFVEHWMEQDSLQLLRQLGVLPAGQGSAA